MAQFTIYNSADASAPVLSGTAGALIALLDAILVNGYGAKPAAGWTKAFTGTNKAAYRPGAGTRFYLRVQDNAGGTAGAKEALVNGFESMSDVDTGSGRFGAAISSSYMVWRKSGTADTAARSWIAFADNSTLYLFLNANEGSYWAGMFGDFFSLAGSGDAWRCAIIGRTAENSASNSPESFGGVAGSATTTLSGHYIARTYGGGSGAIQFGKHGDAIKSGTTVVLTSTTGSVPAPNGPDGAYYLSPIFVTESSGVVRGRMRGLWQLCAPAAGFSDGGTFGGANDLQGKTFMIVKGIAAPTAINQMVVLETSDTLETNS